MDTVDLGPVNLGTGADEAALVRGLQDARLATPGTVVGGYGQLQARWTAEGADPDWQGEASVRRLVVFVSHDFAAQGLPARAYTELEWEDAVAGDGQPGTAEVEQAFLEVDVAGHALAIRAGLVLVPMGIVNQWHEPPVFNGVERPGFDQLVIPSTWRELGVGITGKPGIVRYELYAITPLDPASLDGAGLTNGRTLGAVSPADAVAFTGRFEIEPTLGFVTGLSGYGSDAGGAIDVFDDAGRSVPFRFPIYGGALDARWRGWGFELKAVGALFAMPNVGGLMEALRADGSPYFTPGAEEVPTRVQGGYVEAGWNVLYPFDTDQALVPFARLETYDTQAAVPEGYEANPARTVQEATFGATWRPIPSIAVKADVQLSDRKLGDDALRIEAGFGYMF